MAEKTTFIKIDRNITKWRWYQDATTFRVFVHVLIKANHQPGEFRDITIQRGELATSISTIASDLGISYKEARGAMEKLKKTGEWAITRHSKFLVITVLSYDRYQGDGQSQGKSQGNQKAIKGQQYKNNKNNKNEEELTRARGAHRPPDSGVRAPAFGEGDMLCVVDGFNHRYPHEWQRFADEAGMTIEDYVRKRRQ